MAIIKKKNVGIFIFDNVEILDFSGPYEVFSSVRLSTESRADIYNIPAPLYTKKSHCVLSFLYTLKL